MLQLLSRHRYWFLVLLVGIIFFIYWTQPNFNERGTIKIWDRNHTLLYESVGDIGKKDPITYSQLPKHLIDAAIASEDETFWENPGIDIKAIMRSLITNIQSGRVVSGASTITQQVARASIISPQQQPSRSLIRKIREAIIALRLSAMYSKQDILTHYFNQMYFGNLSYGVEAAASTYFAKDVSQLSLAESAFLIGLLSSPDRRNPFVNFPEAKAKQVQVLDLMVKDGLLTKEKANIAKTEKLTLSQQHATIKAPHFVHYVLEQVGELGIAVDQGINVTTTLDYPTYELSENVAKLWVDKLKNQHDLSNASLILLDNRSGAIIDMLGGIDYFDATHAGQVNMTTALRQPGSALKPVTYAGAFMRGYTPATLIYDVKKVYTTKKGEGFTPQNYDGRYHGLILAREALASSLNLPAVEMLSRIGIPAFLQVARNLGIHTFTQEDRYDLSITLGGGEVKLLELTNVFASLARGGEYKAPYAIESITADSGHTLYQHSDIPGIPALGQQSQQVAFLVSDILSDPKARIPGFHEKNPLVLSRPAAVKTGTTTDWHDNWTVGYTPSYTVGVWVGNNDNHAMREITGVVGAAPIWNQFFEAYLKGKPAEKFVRPDNIAEIQVCALSGKLPDTLCQERRYEVFIKGTEPKEPSHIYKKVRIDTRNNLLAGSACAKEYVHEKIFVDYPPEVYTWAMLDGQAVIPRAYSPLCDGNLEQQGAAYLEITYPREKTVFQSAPYLVTNQAAVFEVSAAPSISKVQWFVDGKPFIQTSTFPFNVSWKLQLGKHTIKAEGSTTAGKKVTSKNVHISVVEFHPNN